MSAIETTCALCGHQRQLLNSHILPKFVYKWLKELSPLRQSDNPNLPVQDGQKEKLLCADCEQLFSPWERAFAKKVFNPFHKNDSQGFYPVRYEKWMLKFAVSVSWRVLHWHCSQGLQVYSDEQMLLIDSALATWREFLLDLRPHPGDFVQHLIPIDLREILNVPDISPNILIYLGETVAPQIACSRTDLFVYSKIGKLLIVGVIQLPAREQPLWQGTKLHVNGGYFPATKTTTMPNVVMQCIKHGTDKLLAAEADTSPRQLKIIAEYIARNPGKFLESEGLRVYEEMFGKSAFPDGEWRANFGPDAVAIPPQPDRTRI